MVAAVAVISFSSGLDVVALSHNEVMERDYHEPIDYYSSSLSRDPADPIKMQIALAMKPHLKERLSLIPFIEEKIENAQVQG